MFAAVIPGRRNHSSTGIALGSAQKEPHMNLNQTGMTLAPTTDVVLPCDEDVLDVLFDRNTRRLIGALHRRFWEKRRKVLHDRAISGDVVSISAGANDRNELMTGDFGEVIADLPRVRESWDGRLDQYSGLREAVNSMGRNAVPSVVRVRGWGETELGILVDGRSVPGCIVDVAIALSHSAHRFRDGVEAFVFSVPEPTDSAEAALWENLMCLAHDRTGIDRGTVRFGSFPHVQHGEPEVAVA